MQTGYRSAHERKRVLVLGASGMLGHGLMFELSERPELEVFGSVRGLDFIPPPVAKVFSGQLVTVADVLDRAQRAALLDTVAPDVVINAVGVIKQAPSVTDLVATVELNALLPHLLAAECSIRGIRVIHVSTDCVFSGREGGYSENSLPDPADFYGRSKLLGEIGAPHLTLRTSVVGHELQRHGSLIDWFLSQQGGVRGFTRAMYSGVTTVEFAHMLANVILPRGDIVGLYHVAADAISKYDLLRLVAATYDWPGEIEAYDDFECDRTLTADLLALATGYRPPTWPAMVAQMKSARQHWASRTNASSGAGA